MTLFKMYRTDRKRLRRDEKAEKGFTLVEIMIAVSIFAIGLLAVASMQVSGTQNTASARWHTDAAVWASDRIEKLISLPYNHADLADGPHPAVTENQFTISYTVADNELIDNTKTITATVTWDDRGQQKNVVFIYYKAAI